MALPPSADISSPYAAEGTFAHVVMEWLMQARRDDGQTDLHRLADAHIGETFHDRKLTREHIDTMILPALLQLEEIEQEYGGGFEVAAIEARVAFPGIPGAFGTIDLILVSGSCVLHVDWKFGQGVPVRAVYKDEYGERVNAQLLYYIAGAMNSLPKIYKGRKALALAIIQPRAPSDQPATAISKKEVKWFIEDLQAAVVEALQREPRLTRGDACRWCPAKISCPKWTAPMLDLAAMKVQPRTEVVERKVTPYGEYLANAKQLVDGLAMFTKEVNDQLHAYLEDGGTVPGWKLKLKAKQRQSINEEIVNKELEQLCFDWDEI